MAMKTATRLIFLLSVGLGLGSEATNENEVVPAFNETNVDDHNNDNVYGIPKEGRLLKSLMVNGDSTHLDYDIHNLASYADFTATSTCGNPPSKYCKLSGTGRHKGLDCAFCDDNDPERSHRITNVIREGTEKWWQSVNGEKDVDVIIDLRQPFFVSSVFLRMGPSPRPRQWLIQKSLDNVTYETWQYFAEDRDTCNQMFGISAKSKPRAVDEAICDIRQSSRDNPLEKGEIIINLIENRLFGRNFSENSPLQSWVKARYIKLSFRKWHSLEGEYFTTKEKSFHDQLFYSISEVGVYGLCVCQISKWSSGCFLQAKSNTTECTCTGNTCGANCDVCCPGFYKVPEPHKGFACKACECHGHSSKCSVIRMGDKADVWCEDCKNNTKGRRCELCLNETFYRPQLQGKRKVNLEIGCKECQCDKQGSRSLYCNKTGDCVCRHHAEGPKCNRCSPGYWGFPDCRKCRCFKSGSTNNTCDPKWGTCNCKEPFVGPECSECPRKMHLINGKCQECSSCQVSLKNDVHNLTREVSYVVSDVCFFIAEDVAYSPTRIRDFLNCIKLDKNPLDFARRLENEVNSTVLKDMEELNTERYNDLAHKVREIETLLEEIRRLKYSSFKAETFREMKMASAAVDWIKYLDRILEERVKSIRYDLNSLQWEFNSIFVALNYTKQVFPQLLARKRLLKERCDNISQTKLEALETAKISLEIASTNIAKSEENEKAIITVITSFRNDLIQWFDSEPAESVLLSRHDSYQFSNRRSHVKKMLKSLNPTKNPKILNNCRNGGCSQTAELKEAVGSIIQVVKAIRRIKQEVPISNNMQQNMSSGNFYKTREDEDLGKMQFNFSDVSNDYDHSLNSDKIKEDARAYLLQHSSIQDLPFKLTDLRKKIEMSERKLGQLQSVVDSLLLQIKALSEEISHFHDDSRTTEFGSNLPVRENIEYQIVELRNKMKEAQSLLRKIKPPFRITSGYFFLPNLTELKTFAANLRPSKGEGLIFRSDNEGPYIQIRLKEWRIELKACGVDWCDEISTESPISKHQLVHLLLRINERVLLNVTYDNEWTELVEILWPSPSTFFQITGRLHVGINPTVSEFEAEDPVGCFDSLHINDLELNMTTLEDIRSSVKFCSPAMTNSTRVITTDGDKIYRLLMTNASFLPFYFEFSFRSFQKNATLLFLKGPNQKLVVYLLSGRIGFEHEMTKPNSMLREREPKSSQSHRIVGQTQRKTYDDRQWHTVQIKRQSTTWYLAVDGSDRDSITTMYWTLDEALDEMWIGGTNLNSNPNFVGCLEDLKLNDVLLSIQQLDDYSGKDISSCHLPTDYCSCISNKLVELHALNTTKIGFNFKTNASSSSLLTYQISLLSAVLVYQEEGEVRVTVENVTVSSDNGTLDPVNRGQWHSLLLHLQKNKLIVAVDEFQIEVPYLLEFSRFPSHQQLLLGPSTASLCYQNLSNGNESIRFSDVIAYGFLEPCQLNFW